MRSGLAFFVAKSGFIAGVRQQIRAESEASDSKAPTPHSVRIEQPGAFKNDCNAYDIARSPRILLTKAK